MNRLISPLRSVPNLFRLPTRLTASNFGLTNKDRKRFYKKVSIAESSQSPNKYEILLDQRKLKTPLGNLIAVENELLASAIAQEWHQQTKKIDLSSMHLNSLINTLVDNPLKTTKEELMGKIMDFLDGDTILYRTDLPEEFRQLQIKSWDPILTLINEKFQTSFRSTYELDMSNLVSQEDRAVIEKYLANFDQQTLTIVLYMVETLKSLLLTISLLKQYRPVESIASLARLETEFQISRWSNVEYHHDYDIMDTKSKISAAYTIFYFLNNSTTETVLNKNS